MQRIHVASLLFLPILLPAILVSGQTADSAQSQDHPPAAASTTQVPKYSIPAPPIPVNAPPMSKQTRYEIIRDFETQIVYARTFFPMGAKGIKLKDGVATPNGPELQQALALWGPAVKPGDPAHISFVQIDRKSVVEE